MILISSLINCRNEEQFKLLGCVNWRVGLTILHPFLIYVQIVSCLYGGTHERLLAVSSVWNHMNLQLIITHICACTWTTFLNDLLTQVKWCMYFYQISTTNEKKSWTTTDEIYLLVLNSLILQGKLGFVCLGKEQLHMHAYMFGNCNVLTCYGGSSLFLGQCRTRCS